MSDASWYSGFFNDEQDTFSQLAGAYLSYEAIQNQSDASGQAQQAVNELPENTQNVQQPVQVVESSSLIAGVPNTYLFMGAAVAVVAIIALK